MSGEKMTSLRTEYPTLDLVIPVYNEEEVLPLLLSELDKTFSKEVLDSKKIKSVRCIFCDDGSKDNSVDILLGAKLQSCDILVLSLSRNFGHQAALASGMSRADADIVGVIDADLQDPPGLILDMVDLWFEGYDVVYGQRRSRKESIIKRTCYRLFYKLYNMVSPIDIAMDSGDFCIMGRCVVETLQRLPETLRFQRGLRSWVGFKQIGLEYDRPERAKGDTKYNFSMLYRLATDGLTSLSISPLKMTQTGALAFMFFAMVTLILLTFNVFSFFSTEILMLFILILISNSYILFCMYIQGAYIGRGYLESKRRPPFIIMQSIEIKAHDNIDSENGAEL